MSSSKQLSELVQLLRSHEAYFRDESARLVDALDTLSAATSKLERRVDEVDDYAMESLQMNRSYHYPVVIHQIYLAIRAVEDLASAMRIR